MQIIYNCMLVRIRLSLARSLYSCSRIYWIRLHLHVVLKHYFLLSTPLSLFFLLLFTCLELSSKNNQVLLIQCTHIFLSFWKIVIKELCVSNWVAKIASIAYFFIESFWHILLSDSVFTVMFFKVSLYILFSCFALITTLNIEATTIFL